MTLAPGSHIGPYEIAALIGAGGMGEVYRARDTRLKRDVAIKILPHAFSSDPERLLRFQREAELLATLNHPNIAQIYGLEDRALVLELVEGPTLEDRIAQRPMPLDEALPIARQIADALEAAHERGIIHRDLKPANIKVTADGNVKVLDFGLAKAMDSHGVASSGQDLSLSPTLTTPGSVSGAILGTAAYMSPEQARGKPVDKRADIWAFGVVLYQMITGRPALKENQFPTSSRLCWTKEPEWTRTPPQVQRLLRCCLKKDPRHRLRDIGDAWELLEQGQEASSAKSRAPWIAAGVMTMFAALATFGWWRAAHDVELPLQAPIRLDMDLGSDVTIGSTIGPTAVISPDATRIVFVSQSSDSTLGWLCGCSTGRR